MIVRYRFLRVCVPDNFQSGGNEAALTSDAAQDGWPTQNVRIGPEADQPRTEGAVGEGQSQEEVAHSLFMYLQQLSEHSFGVPFEGEHFDSSGCNMG